MFSVLSTEECHALAANSLSGQRVAAALTAFTRQWLGPAKSFADRAMRFDAEVPMADSTLQVVRQAARLAGVTHDTPFLSADIVAFSRRLPRSALIQDGVGKAPLRRLLGRRMPSDLWRLPKIGLRLPLVQIIEDHRSTVEEILRSDDDLLNLRVVDEWLREFLAGRQPRSYLAARRVWHVLVWKLWLDAHRGDGGQQK